jgi:hypothetical protein
MTGMAVAGVESAVSLLIATMPGMAAVTVGDLARTGLATLFCAIESEIVIVYLMTTAISSVLVEHGVTDVIKS